MNKEEIEKLLAPAMSEVAKTGRSVDAIADVVEKLEAAHQREIRVLQRAVVLQVNQVLFWGQDPPAYSQISDPAAVLEAKRLNSASAFINEADTPDCPLSDDSLPDFTNSMLKAVGYALGVDDLTGIYSTPDSEASYVFAYSPSLFRLEDSPTGRAEAASDEHPLAVVSEDADQEESS